jgi:hypothetical protein
MAHPQNIGVIMLKPQEIDRIKWENEEYTRWDEGITHQGSQVSNLYFRLFLYYLEIIYNFFF